MVESLQVQLKHPGIALSEKETRLIECLILRICAHHLYRRVSGSFRIRPAQVDSIHLLVNQAVEVERTLTEEEAGVLIRDITDDIRKTLALCDVGSEPVVLSAKA